MKDKSGPGKKVVEATKVYPDAVLGWHGMSRCIEEKDGMKFLCGNGDDREIKIGESLTVQDEKAKICIQRYGFHCSDFQYTYEQYGSKYMQHIELTGIGDQSNNIYAAKTRKCLGIINSGSLLRQLLAHEWRLLLQDLRMKYPEGHNLNEVEDVLLNMELNGEGNKNEKVTKALKFTVAGKSLNDNYDSDDFEEADCPMMMMGPFGFMGHRRGSIKAMVKNHHTTSSLGKKFLQSILDNRLDALFQEARKALQELQEAEGVSIVQEKTKALSEALELFYKGTYPEYIICDLRSFLNNGDQRVSNYMRSRVALDRVDAMKLCTIENLPNEYEKEKEDRVKEFWKRFEDRCLEAAIKSEKTGKIVSIL